MITKEQISRFCDIPFVVDGGELEDSQAHFLTHLVSKLMTEAEHPFDTAMELALKAFRSSFELQDMRWVAREQVCYTKSGDKTVRNIFPLLYGEIHERHFG